MGKTDRPSERLESHIKQVKQAIKTTKMGKSPGPGGINPELVKCGPP